MGLMLLVFIQFLSGQYDISSQAQSSGNFSGVNTGVSIAVFIDGVEAYSKGEVAQGAVTGLILSPRIDVKAVPLKAGQIVSIRFYTDGTAASYTTSSARNFFSITRSEVTNEKT